MEIIAKIIAHSVSLTGKEILTYELVYPRIIHAELMTHKILSKNCASSRAIPVSKVIEMVRNSPARPVRFGANQAGMQDQGENHKEPVIIDGLPYEARAAWFTAAHSAAKFSEAFSEAGYHKQVCNRITEPYQWMKTVLTGTEFVNFFWLRKHLAADPTLYALATKMFEAYENSAPALIGSGDWHLPYYQSGFWMSTTMDYGVLRDSHGFSLEDATNISMSCCAQVSYRTLDDSLEKAERVVERLNLGVDLDEPCHASPSEHLATPMRELVGPSKVTGWNNCVNLPQMVDTWEEGITAYHKHLGFMSGNLAGWVQKRQLIEGHVKW